MNLHYLNSLIISGFISLIISFPVTGFIAGMVLCKDCNKSLLSNTFGRAFVGLVFAVMNSVFLGRPPKNEGGVGEPYNLLIYNFAVWIILFILIFYSYNYKKS